jgi:hypothetical protein
MIGLQWRPGVAALILLMVPGMVTAAGPNFSPGAAGAGDPYFPLDGNGGYDVSDYRLNVRYDPDTDELFGRAVISARAMRNLSSFNLDLDGLSVERIRVDGSRAGWSRDGAELTVTPAAGIPRGERFEVVVVYSGVPETIEDIFGLSGFIHTEDGALVVGEPHVAATWFPANDHPSDRASFTFAITVPEGLQAVANGVLRGSRTANGWTTWRWRAADPMATYLAGMSIGHLQIDAYREDGIRYWDAVDTTFLEPVATPRTGSQFAISQQADASYKRLWRRIDVPAEGAELTFWVQRDTEDFFDFFFVEARTAGQNDWTTLRDRNGHNNRSTGFACPFWLDLHPHLRHYQSGEFPEGDEEPSCEPQGTTGKWWAASGPSDGWEQWSVDLSRWSGQQITLALSYASDESVQLNGVFVDDIVVSTGQGTTSFEDDGDVMDGWLAKGPPRGSPPNLNNWIAGTVSDGPPSIGEFMLDSFRRQPEIIRFLEGFAGPYPFDVAGGIVDDVPIGFALENQTRPIYSPFFFLFDPFSAEFVIVHELAHQWYGDSLTVKQWQHIWLNEGFATYTEWLWAEAQGFGTAQETFDFLYEEIPEDDPFWLLTIGDPGPDHLFDGEVYTRGAMTLHALRMAVGDEDFFRILRRWAQNREGELVMTAQFVRLAERISGQQLDTLFEAWLFSSGKPGLAAASLSERSVESGHHRMTAAARHLVLRLKLDHEVPRALR